MSNFLTHPHVPNSVRDGEGGQAGAAVERSFLNSPHAIGDVDRGQAGTVIESQILDACHAVWDGDRGQFGAVSESENPDARHAVRDYCTFNAFIFYTFKNCACFVKYKEIVIHGRIDQCRYKGMK